MRRCSNNIIKILWVVLFLQYLYIFIFLLNHYFAWMHRESFVTHEWILSNGKTWQWEDFARALNIDVLEASAVRLSRPLSDLLEIVDTKFRATLWDHIPPHPSLSLFWPLSFVGIPVFLYRFFKNMGCSAAIALGGVCMYLSSVGFLGPVVMLFHPAKNLLNFMAVFSLFLGSRIYQKVLAAGPRYATQDIPYFWRDFIFLMLSIFVSFFIDETGLVLYVMIAMMFYPVLVRCRQWPQVLRAFLLLPLAYVLTIHWFLPKLHWWVRHKHIDFSEYQSYPKLSAVLTPQWWETLWTSITWYFVDHPHLNPHWEMFFYNKTLFFIHMAYLAVMGLVIWKFIAQVRKNPSSQRLREILSCVAMAIPIIVFNTLALSAPWGLWYYGSFFSLMYFMALTFALQFIWERGKFMPYVLALVIAVMTLETMAFATYRVDIFNTTVEDNIIYEYKDVFTENIGYYFQRFDVLGSLKVSECRQMYAKYKWSQAKNKPYDYEDPRVDRCNEWFRHDPAYIVKSKYLDVEL